MAETVDEKECEVVTVERSVIATREHVASEVSYRKRTTSLPNKPLSQQEIIRLQSIQGGGTLLISDMLEDFSRVSWDEERFK